MRIPAGVIFIWTGTNAAIPSGWERVTALDGRYPKGAAASTDPNTTGGNPFHSHSATSTHTHSMENHTHTISIGTGKTGLATGSGSNTNDAAHNHSGMTSGAAQSASVSTESATYSSVSNDPPYYAVIYITPSSDITDGTLPKGVICLTSNAVLPGFYVCDGNNGTPNFVGKYLKGANTGANAGETGGSTTNIHHLSHTHTTSHSHAAATSGSTASTPCDSRATASNPPTATGDHNHSISLPEVTLSTSDNVSLETTETVEPAYTKLMAMMNDSAGTISNGVIALWRGSLASIPAGWKLLDGADGLVDMRGRHLKITATLGEVGDTGGSNTHSHASQSHGHTISHSHSTTVYHSGSRGVKNSGRTAKTAGTYHNVTTTSDNIVLADSSTAADSQSNEPDYLTVAFIQLSGEEFSKEVSDSMSVDTVVTKHPNKVASDSPSISDTYSRRGDFTRTLPDTISLNDVFSYFFLLYKKLSETIKITVSFSKKISRIYLVVLSVSDVISKHFAKIFDYVISITENYINIATIRDKMFLGRIFGSASNNSRIGYNKNNKPEIRGGCDNDGNKPNIL